MGAASRDTSSAPTAAQRRRAAAYFLIGLGLPIAVAFLYPLAPSRQGGSLWGMTDHPPRALAVLLIGAAAGLALIGIGLIMLWTAPPVRPPRSGSS